MQPMWPEGYPPPGPMVHPNQGQMMQPPPGQPIMHQPGSPMVPPGGSGPGGGPIMHHPGGTMVPQGGSGPGGVPIMHQPGGPLGPPPSVMGPGHGGPIMGHGGRAWMEFPTAIPPDCPPGLEYLAAVDRILVEQLIEPFEIITNIETANRYLLMNAYGQQVFFAAEQSDFCARQCCGSNREFIMSILDNAGVEVRSLRDVSYSLSRDWRNSKNSKVMDSFKLCQVEALRSTTAESGR
ncbi:MAG: hypothetical protein GY696_36805 [Gammaproteobacteria bacterium]|nr:hypothetical protein [Gammaproteobacteria bacterium]